MPASWMNDLTNFDGWGADPTSGSGGFNWGNILGGIGGYFGSQGGDPQTTTTQVNPALQNLLTGVGNRGTQILDQPYEAPPNQVAGPSPWQLAGWDMGTNWAENNQLPQQASDAMSGMLAGGGNMAPQGSNPYMGRTTSVGTNPYAGSNPYLEQNIQNTMGDMARTYNQQVAPTMAANAYQSGSFGNTGQQEMENESRNQLQQNLGRTSQNMRMQDYGMQQGLAESDIARRMGAQQTDYARNAGISESGLNRASSDWNAAQGRNLSAMNMAPSVYNMGFGGADYLGRIGNDARGITNQTLQGDLYNFNDARNWPTRNFNTARSIFGGANPGGSNSVSDPGTNPVAGAIGGSMFGQDFWNQLFRQP